VLLASIFYAPSKADGTKSIHRFNLLLLLTIMIIIIIIIIIISSIAVRIFNNNNNNNNNLPIYIAHIYIF